MGDQTPKSEMVETLTPDFSDLIAKLSEAKAGSRELDREMAERFGWKFHGNLRFWMKPDWWTPLEAVEGVPHFTTSVDAALALIEKRLPDRLVENFGEMRDSGPLTGHWLAQLGPRGPRRRLVGPITGANLQATLDAEVLCSAETGPLALCIALLKALQAQTDAALKPEGGS